MSETGWQISRLGQRVPIKMTAITALAPVAEMTVFAANQTIVIISCSKKNTTVAEKI